MNIFKDKIAKLFSGQKPQHETAAFRLQSAGRIPFNIWGDFFTNGNPPQIRRALIGQDAHECLLVYFYFGEIMTLTEVLENAHKLDNNFKSKNTIDQIKILKSFCNDQMSHINTELFETFLPILLVMEKCN